MRSKPSNNLLVNDVDVTSTASSADSKPNTSVLVFSKRSNSQLTSLLKILNCSPLFSAALPSAATCGSAASLSVDRLRTVAARSAIRSSKNSIWPAYFCALPRATCLSNLSPKAPAACACISARCAAASASFSRCSSRIWSLMWLICACLSRPTSVSINSLLALLASCVR